ncbi:MAG: hypothetical protein IKZ38_04810 [Clostridia bacterium]|nr:hypothetical protein [Clostridia bacterium]
MEQTIRVKKKMALWLKLTIFCSIIVGILAIFGGAIGYFKLSVNKYYRASEKGFKIPEIGGGYVPQGLHYDEATEQFVLAGYMTDHSASPVYLVNDKGELVKKVTLKMPDGSDYVGHGGGIAIGGMYVYVTGGEDACLYVYNYADLLSAKTGDKLDCVGVFSLKVSDDDYIENAFVTIYGDRLITGEFYREGSYPTLNSHKFNTKAGDYNQALAVEYKLDKTQPCGIDANVVKAYSLPDQVQGLSVYNNKIYLSTSWSVSFSHILEYDITKLNSEGNIKVLGQQTQLFALDSASLVYDYKVAPMSEEMAFVNGKLYINCESACNKYIFGKFTGGKWIYKTDLSEMVK